MLDRQGRVGYSRQISEKAEVLAQVEARRRHRLAGEAARYHATNAQHVTGVKGGVAKRTKGEECHGRSEDDHTQDDC